MAVMKQNEHSCIKRGAEALECLLCKAVCKKNGKTAAGKQRYKCKTCHKTFIVKYSYQSYKVADVSISTLLKEGCGIRSMSRILSISISTVAKRILQISKGICKPFISINKTYEVDEIRTYYKNKGRLLWLVYALQRDTKKVVDFAIGSRTKATLEKVISTLTLSRAERIYTDKLCLYNFLIPAAMHSNKQYGTNNIERKNLSIRTHIKRLNRKTICFSKSISMLSACIKIYFWG